MQRRCRPGRVAQKKPDNAPAVHDTARATVSATAMSLKAMATAVWLDGACLHQDGRQLLRRASCRMLSLRGFALYRY